MAPGVQEYQATGLLEMPAAHEKFQMPGGTKSQFLHGSIMFRRGLGKENTSAGKDVLPYGTGIPISGGLTPVRQSIRHMRERYVSSKVEN